MKPIPHPIVSESWTQPEAGEELGVVERMAAEDSQVTISPMTDRCSCESSPGDELGSRLVECVTLAASVGT
jgi:hypothetical protein